MFDIYNVTNSNAVTNFFLTSGATYNQIIAALNPRTVQIGLRITF
jgi:outer membrane receptor protein involved in Fe transport